MWLLLSHLIPSQEDATGWFAQAYSLASAVGAPTLVAASVIGIFIVGAISQGVTEPLASVIGRLTSAVSRRFSANSDPAFRRHDVIAEAYGNVRADELRGRLSESDADGPLFKFNEEVFQAVLADPEDNVIFRRLREELSGDSLDVLRAINPAAHEDLQRERAERAVRLAISFPLVAIGVLLLATVSIWGGVPLVLLGVVLMFRFSADLSDEPERVLRLLLLGGGSTPAINALRSNGRSDLANYQARMVKVLRDQQARRATEKAKREADEIIKAVDAAAGR